MALVARARHPRRGLSSRTLAALSGVLVCIVITASRLLGPTLNQRAHDAWQRLAGLMGRSSPVPALQPPPSGAASDTPDDRGRPSARILPLYPGLAVDLIHDSTPEGKDRVQAMGSTRATPQQVVAFYKACSTDGSLQVKKLTIAGQSTWMLRSKLHERSLHVTVTQGLSRDGATTIVTTVSCAPGVAPDR